MISRIIKSFLQAWRDVFAMHMVVPSVVRVTKATLACLCVSSFLAIPAYADDKREFIDITLTPSSIESELRGEMRTDAKEMAQILNVQPLVDRLRASRSTGESDYAHMPKPLLQAKVLALYKIMIAGEEVRKLVASIERELATSYVSLDILNNRNNQIHNTLNTLTFAQGGVLGICKQSLFLHNAFKASQYPLIVSASNSTAFSLINLLVPSFLSRPIEKSPNTLAHFFDPNYRPADAEISYVYKWFNTAIPGTSTGLLRRELLIKHWQAFSGVKAGDDHQSRVLAEAPRESETLKESIKVLNERINLLHDLKTHVEEFDYALYELHKSIR